MSLERMNDAIRSATMEQFTTAHEDLSLIMRYAELRQGVEERVLPARQRLSGLEDIPFHDPIAQASMLPALLATASSEWRQGFCSELAKLEAMNNLLSALPEKFHRFLLQEQPSESEREEAAPILSAWANQHPAEAKLLAIQASEDPSGSA